ncbi:MAG TPA: sigma-70 family RNA polymerase sigma factor [Pirellulaceae bacterium]|nr:sigma-70 family RNA polymerase sigma factor [Pirellulaceae bacterium]
MSEISILVARCLKGQQAAFSELVGRYQGAVYKLCLRMLGHREDAEDATQETFVRVANSLHHWDNERKFEPWLMTIAGNRCRTKLARRARQMHPISLDHPVADRSHLQTQAQNLAEEMDLVLQDMRPEWRQAFLLFYERQLAYGEIAEELDVPLGTVKTWVHRARQVLIDRLSRREVIQVRT